MKATRWLSAPFFVSVSSLIEGRFPNWSHARHRARWDDRWARSDFKPFWRTPQPQREFIKAVETGWFPKDRWIYDIGCGGGESSRWLNNQGLCTIGLDFSPVAIDICRRDAGQDNERLRFEVMDMCGNEMPLEPTAAIFDRGCFQAIRRRFRPAYVRNAARLTEPGGHFLLIAATYQHESYKHNRHVRPQNQLREEVEQLFRECFTIEFAEATDINSSDGRLVMPAVSFWMVRRGTQLRQWTLPKQLMNSQMDQVGEVTPLSVRHGGLRTLPEVTIQP